MGACVNTQYNTGFETPGEAKRTKTCSKRERHTSLQLFIQYEVMSHVFVDMDGGDYEVFRGDQQHPSIKCSLVVD